MAETRTIIKSDKERQYIKIVQEAGDTDTSIIHTLGASSVTIITDKDITLKVPQIDSDGDPTATEAPYAYSGTASAADNDASTTNMHAQISANKAGWISGSVMPPFITINNATGDVSNIYIYIIWRK